MSVNPAGGARVFIGTTNIAANLGQFEADSYIEIEEVEDGGQVGDESAAITFTALKDGRVRKFKGPRDAGTLALVVGKDALDEGQAALIAAEGQKFDYNFKIMLNDQITLGGTPTILYFYAKVMSKRDNVGNVSNVVKTTFNLGVNSPITSVDPT
jgi:hypothetical protein